MGDRAHKDALFEAIALMGKAFASPVRLELLDLLAQAPRSVDELARASGQSTANTSQHLQALHAAGHGHARARGHARALRARGRRGAAAVARAARRLGRAPGRGRARRARLPRRGRRHDRPRGAAGSGSRAATSCSSTSGPKHEYAAGHIEGARSIPLDELERRLAELPPDTEVVAYCRGPFCAYAHEAVRRLPRRRPHARAGYEDGWPEWRLARTGPHEKHRPVDVDSCARRSARPTPTSRPTRTREFIFPTGRAWAAGARLPASPSSRACPTRPSRASPASPTTGRSGAIEPGEVVLDLGCGAGTDLLIAAQMSGTDGRAIGVDMTPAMLERATRARARWASRTSSCTRR